MGGGRPHLQNRIKSNMSSTWYKCHIHSTLTVQRPLLGPYVGLKCSCTPCYIINRTINGLKSKLQCAKSMDFPTRGVIVGLCSTRADVLILKYEFILLDGYV